MTREEAKRIMEIERTCVLRQGTPECGRDEYGCGACDLVQSSDDVIEAYGVAIKALEQEPREDEYIKVPKKALKYRTAGMVAYNAEWLKNNFDIERAVICGAQEPCEDCISRFSIKQKLQEHHDFFVNAYSGFSNMPLNDKSRVDEISNCIAMVVNEPSVTPQPKTGHWITKRTITHDGEFYCDICGNDAPFNKTFHFCPNCGSMMKIKE